MLPDSSPEPPTSESDRPRSTFPERLVALLEVLICSGFPTQIALAATFNALGYRPYGPSGQFEIAYVVGVSLVDAALLIALIVLFLYAHGETPRDVFLGRRSVVGEVGYGLSLTIMVLVAAVAVLLTIRNVAPWLRTVEQNPIEGLMTSGRDAWLFAFVVIVAGGIREEAQRAFLLHRFKVWLGGPTVGVIVTSTAFGAGHLVQGADAAIVTGLLGALWAVVYLRRRSAVAPMVSHAGFNLLQIVQFVFTRG